VRTLIVTVAHLPLFSTASRQVKRDGPNARTFREIVRSPICGDANTSRAGLRIFPDEMMIARLC
jgi:hypothetical protein